MLLAAAFPAAAFASSTQESMFQDDPLIVNASTPRMTKTLDRLKSIGVNRIRVSLFWNRIAPFADQVQRPSFNAADPAAYPPEGWAHYDAIIQAAQARGIGVNLNITSPVPRWAASDSPRADLQGTYGPSASEFGQFVTAVGTRYSGTYGGLPRVDFWSIWNEPNQAGWLTPQWSPDPRDPARMVESSPALYRQLLGAAYAGLVNTGHAQDTILIGDTAPKGQQLKTGISQSLDPLRFIRQLYCLDDNLQFIKGTSADVRGCPQDPATFVAQNPALFHTTGFGHHPYELLHPPTFKYTWPDWVTIGNLNSLTRTLRRVYQRYAQPLPTPKGVPLYLTEFGEQTKPDPFGIPFAKQASELNQSDFLAYSNPLVRTLCQFLLNDDAPVAGIDPKAHPFAAYLTFQTGLRSLAGKNKPAYAAYITPIWIPKPVGRQGASMRVWGWLRPAASGVSKTARIQFRRKGQKRWRTIRSLHVGGERHFVDVHVKRPGTGSVRISWSNANHTLTSRAAPVRG